MRSWSCFVYAVLVVALASASFHGVDAQFNSVDGIYSTGLGILYTMVDQFLEVVQPSGGTTFIGAVNEYLIPDILQCFFNSSSTCNSTAQMIALDSLKMLMVVAGIATCVIFGILYIIVMCCGCCVFSCCRKCGLCGGKISKKPVQKSDKIKRPVLTVVVAAITVMIGAGLVCSLLSDVAISNLVAVDKDTNQIPIIKAATDILQSATTLIKKYINDASSLSNPLSDTVDFIFGQLTVLENELLQVIKNDSVLNTTLSDIDDLLTEARRMNDTLTTISQTTRDLQSLQRDLNATLVNISQDILSIISGCQTQDCDRLNTNAISLATATPNFSQVPDVSKALMNLQDILNNSAATNFEMKLREFTNKANETVASVKNITDQLLNLTQLIDSLLGSFGVNNIDALVTPYIEFLNNTTPFFSEPKAGPFTISQLVLLILAGYGITILLVIICNLGGILTGLCCKRPISKTKGSCSSKKASETFFKCSTTCSFSAGSLTMVFVVILFAITVPFYIELCRDRENYNSTRYKDLDNLTHVLINYFDETGKIPETLNVGNVKINISLILSRLYVATLVRECQNNQSILTMAIDLLTVDELYRIANQIVDEKVNPLLEDLRDTLNVTLSGLVDTLISNSTLKLLDDSVSSIPDKSNFSSVIDQFWNVSQLNSTLQNTADMADNVSSHPSTAGLQEQAERLRSASVTYVTPIVQKTDQLNKSLEELSNSAIKSQINATLRSLETAKNYISSNKSQLIDSILTLVKHFIKEKVPEVIDFAIQDLSAFFGCRYLYNLIDGIFNLICDPLQPIMALWFSYGWCLFFFIPSIIFGLWLGGLNARQLDPPSSEKKKGAPPSHEKGREGPETYNSRTEGPDSQTYFDRGPRGMPPPGYPADCNHRSLRDRCRFFRFPAAKKEFKTWENASRRQDRKAKHDDRLCSCHFKDGVKSNGPTVFKYNSTKSFNFCSPEKKKRTKKGTFEQVDAEETLQNCTEAETEASPQPCLPPVLTPKKIQLLKCDNVVQSIEIDMLQETVKRLESKLDKARQAFTYKSVESKAKIVEHYTGLSPDMFKIVLNLCMRFDISYRDGWKVECVSPEDQLFITLMKLRRNLSHIDLSVRFGVSAQTVGNIVTTWILVLHEILFKFMLQGNGIPSLNKNKGCMPTCFATFTNCRITLDCTEVQCAIPNKSMLHQSQTFSHYKQRNTFKALIGVAPNGVITFVSDLYPGSASDKAVVEHCRLMSQMSPGDLILADKGFLIQSLLPQGVTVNVPPFLKHGRFTAQEVKLTTSIARARIHVERAIARIKGYSILDFVEAHYRTMVSEIFQVCSCLVNLQNPILKEVEDKPLE